MAREAEWAAGVLAQKVEQASSGPGVRVWMDRLEREHDNFRAALDWFVETRQADAGMQLASLLQPFWGGRGHLTEGRERLDVLLAMAGPAETTTRALALDRAGILARWQGDYVAARTLCQESLDLARRLRNPLIIAKTLNNLANAVVAQGDLTTAQSLYEESLGIVREVGDRQGMGIVLSCLGKLALDQGDALRGRPLLEEGLAMARDLEDRWQQANIITTLGVTLKVMATLYQRARSSRKACGSDEN
jgi:hypothetical protein